MPSTPLTPEDWRIDGYLYSKWMQSSPSYMHQIPAGGTGEPSSLTTTPNYVAYASGTHLRAFSIGDVTTTRTFPGLLWDAVIPREIQSLDFANFDLLVDVSDVLMGQATAPGEVGNARWRRLYENTGGSVRADIVIPFPGATASTTTVASALTPLTPADNVIAFGTSAPSAVTTYRLLGSTATQLGTTAITGQVKGITAGPEDVWVLSNDGTSNVLRRHGWNLSPRGSLASFPGDVLGIAGGQDTNNPGGNAFIVVLVKADGSTKPTLHAFTPSLTVSVSAEIPEGEPIGLRVTYDSIDNVEYAWVATRGPAQNYIYRFRVSGTGIAFLQKVSLFDRTPVDFDVTPGNAGEEPKEGEKPFLPIGYKGFVHVLTRN